MIFPDDLPHVLEYRCGVTVRIALPRRPVSYVSTSGVTDAAQVCPQIPYGATAWRSEGTDWQEMSTLPAHWLPFLDRARGSEMDPRRPHKKEK